MKKRFKTRLIHVFVLAVIMLSLADSAQAQVKFGQNSATINANSLLELESTNKGLLLPRVALSATNLASPLSAHVAGMVVYNTATAGTSPNNVSPGYYYNDGAKWNRIATSPDIILPSISISSSTAPTGIAVGQMVYNTTNVAGPPVIPVGPTYWDGTNWVPISGDPAIGNEVTDSTLNGGLNRSGLGTAVSPYTLGLKSGTAANQTMVWNGTSWIVGTVGLVTTNITSSTGPVGRSIGEMIYNTNSTVGPVGPTYWNGTSWVPVAGNDWTTSGNSVNGGNFLGTTNNASLRIRTNSTQKMVVDSMGKVGIGTTTPTSTLEVNGSATNTAASSSTTRSINFVTSNLAYTTASAGAFTLTGMKDGGTYTLAVQGATAGTSSFTHAGLTFRQVNNVATTASKHTLYTFIVMGTTVYYWMNGGL